MLHIRALLLYCISYFTNFDFSISGVAYNYFLYIIQKYLKRIKQQTIYCDKKVWLLFQRIQKKQVVVGNNQNLIQVYSINTCFNIQQKFYNFNSITIMLLNNIFINTDQVQSI
ncbi:transmembrane protein, putative (macronuclear) [Tetrahymena thermophila SB210]|uniref:Transmembrane protein, putative n=1 Tax=Tetrahymena thermophila (strain SB210) TaxID=312017 RepID=W7X4H2_TETTS|nr:transmembrane protein, putative [Tetrahymena thermophila SB210]EWS74230.1 transmembrane protein, putative [Tetrahymena thermophila SB210]|eukprot:XP_012653203.1 transmembrane protein, putative [Tetrahymena thermophila SB210]